MIGWLALAACVAWWIAIGYAYLRTVPSASTKYTET